MSNIEVGDIVKVVSARKCYSYYSRWADLHNLQRYKGGGSGINGMECIVASVGSHHHNNWATILGIEDLNTKQQYIIGIEGVELVSKKEVRDYSHIKQGMYVLISELGGKKDEVVEAFGKAEGIEKVWPDFLDTEDYLGIDSGSTVDTHDNVSYFGANNQQVSVDFILNGPKKEEPKTFEEFVQHCIDNKKGFKVRVTPEISRLVQETVLKCGGGWVSGEKNVIRVVEGKYLYLEEGLCADAWGMTYGVHQSHYENHKNQEIVVEPVTTLKLVEVVKPKSEEDIAREKREEKIKELEEKAEGLLGQIAELRKLN